MRILHDILTALDGESFVICKVLGLALVVVFICLEIYQVVVGKPVFDAVAYGTGSGLVISAMGLAIKVTETTEPKE